MTWPPTIPANYLSILAWLTSRTISTPAGTMAENSTTEGSGLDLITTPIIAYESLRIDQRVWTTSKRDVPTKSKMAASKTRIRRMSLPSAGNEPEQASSDVAPKDPNEKPFMPGAISLLNVCFESPCQIAVAYRASVTHANSRASMMIVTGSSMEMAYQGAATTFSFYPMTRQRRPRKTSHKASYPNISPQTMYTMWRRDSFRKIEKTKESNRKSASATLFRHCCTLPKRRQSPNQLTNRRRSP